MDSDSPNQMKPELRERRKETWNRLIVQGIPYRQVCDRLAEKYDVKPNTIEKDISRMDEWISKLVAVDDTSGYSRLMEIRENRRRLQRMAMEARRDGDRDEELSIRRQIDKAVQLDVQLSQSLGLTPRAPEQFDVSGDLSHDHDHDHDHEHKHAHGEVGNLSETQRKHIDALTSGPEEIAVEAVEDGSDSGDDS